MTAPPPGPYGPPPEGPPPWPQQPPYAQPGDVPPQYGPPQYGPPQYGPPQYGPPQYGPPQYGPPQYGPPPDEQQPHYGEQPQYGEPQYGQPPYGPPPDYGQQPPTGAPPKGDRTPLIVAVAVVLAAAIGVTLFLVLRDDDNGTLAGGPSGSPTAAGSSLSVSTGGAGSSAPVASSSAGADPAALRVKVIALYAGLTSAYAKAAATHDPTVVGTYTAAHNNSSLGYTATQCNATSAALTDPFVFLPDLQSLRLDPSFTKIVNGRYAGRPVAGKTYALSLTTRSAKGEAATSTVHVAVGSDGGVTFFFECE